ncbi:uncharacterized protein MONBRDRAFT_17165 [Monosiga brevicollis MX1]|uniref:AP-2 complex subunit alpha n=1 Tax=Monosiga brevicollis TaxID=81824 RepID=A9UPX3_MONBE|nr:uncharacterized protein MONBRDRAFT_17165 [Monosiga brevicollis MX1]EDQ92948.1 predicted protein [Monosiga brevicollis MX1]|eukprot:XP_001742710.1 hypothetical protein [Monosiga brevicollis MX1]
MVKEDMRGLHNFITDVRACKSQEAEVKRINKELANIRSKFGDKKSLNGYQKKKYVCKLLFIFLLGHEIEFGHMEAVNLLSSLQFSEKQMGYLFASVMMNEHHELMRLVITAIKTDLTDRNELNVALALHCISNIGGKETAAAVHGEVTRLLVAHESPKSVQKKAALAALRLYREAPEHMALDKASRQIVQLLTSSDYGVVMSVASLIISVAADHPEDFAECVPLAINTLHRIVFQPDQSKKYAYHGVNAPWLSVKLLRLLQLFPFPADTAVAERLVETLRRILQSEARTPGRKPRAQFLNSKNASLIEAINLIAVHDNEPELQIRACGILGNMLSSDEVNSRFLALEALTVMAQTEFSHDAVKKHQSAVLRALQTEKDYSVQRRAADLLYALCDQESVEMIVDQLLDFLKRAAYAVREELVIKIAILAEKYAPIYSWYVDVMLRLIKQTGDYVPQQVLYRVVQVIINRQDVQDYAAKTCYEALLDPAAHEAMVNIGGYVLGEFGHLIANDPNSTPTKQLDVLQMHYPMMSASTRGLLLSTYAKLANLFPELRTTVLNLLQSENLLRNSNNELQQRANEYVQLLSSGNAELVPSVFEEMPPFNEEQCAMLQKLEDKSAASAMDTKTGSIAVARKRKQAAPLAAVTAAGHTGVSGASSVATVGNEQFLPKFILQDDGVLYENPVLQIGVKSEFTASVGRLIVFYGNRGEAPMTNVSARAYCVGNMQALKLELAPLESTIAAGVQMQQQLQVECAGCFTEPPVLEVTLTYQSRPVVLSLKLPIFLNKFMSGLPSPMTADTFFQKWNQLGGPPRETQQILKAKEPVNADAMKSKISQFKLQTLPGIDPKPLNCVAAGILHVTSAQVGVLLRAEPSMDAQMYRFTMRTSSEAVTAALSGLLFGQF